MILLTGAQRDRLLANGRQRDQDHIPVVKFFNPFGEGVWLATELDEDGDIMFGLADLGYPELGSWLEVMREDSRAIVRAASQASKAADWLLSHLPAEDTGESDASVTDRRAAA